MHSKPFPAESAPGIVYDLPSIIERIELKQLFSEAQPLEVELGSGDGSFLLQLAARHPEKNFIGVERLLGRLRKLERRGKRAGLTNLRGLRIESAYFLEYLLPRHSTAALHIYFPDPWPKRKHQRYRLLNERFPALAENALGAGGVVYLRTDDVNYFEQMLRVFNASKTFEAVGTPPDLASIRTDFELDFQARGIATLRAAYRKVT